MKISTMADEARQRRAETRGGGRGGTGRQGKEAGEGGGIRMELVPGILFRNADSAATQGKRTLPTKLKMKQKEKPKSETKWRRLFTETTDSSSSSSSSSSSASLPSIPPSPPIRPEPPFRSGSISTPFKLINRSNNRIIHARSLFGLSGRHPNRNQSIHPPLNRYLKRTIPINADNISIKSGM